MATTVFGRMGVSRYHGPQESGVVHRLASVHTAMPTFEEAATLHAHDGLFSMHIEPEPAPEDLVDWAIQRRSARA